MGDGNEEWKNGSWLMVGEFRSLQFNVWRDIPND
jgi:hypothetical protein